MVDAEQYVEVPWVETDGDKVITKSCDICFESYLEDVWANKEIRKFYQENREFGVIVCEKCIALPPSVLPE